MSRDGYVALPGGAMGLFAVCGVNWSYSLTILEIAFLCSMLKILSYIRNIFKTNVII